MSRTLRGQTQSQLARRAAVQRRRKTGGARDELALGLRHLGEELLDLPPRVLDLRPRQRGSERRPASRRRGPQEPEGEQRSWSCAAAGGGARVRTVDALVTDMRNCALIVFRATHTTRTRRTEGSIASAAPPALAAAADGCSRSNI